MCLYRDRAGRGGAAVGATDADRMLPQSELYLPLIAAQPTDSDVADAARGGPRQCVALRAARARPLAHCWLD